jgi:DNA polymerase I-like protein with 3'-5' exonuclease and polymerase domains
VFCAEEGRRLIQFDTSAGEYRWLAGVSNDTNLLEVFHLYDGSGDSRNHPHVVNTSLLFGVDRETAAKWKASDDPHDKARYTFSKNYLYRLMFSYTGGIDELRATAAKAGLKFSRKDIAALDAKWFAAFPQAAAWRDRQVRQVLRSRLVENSVWGYSRRLHAQDEAHLSNIALNYVTQSGIAGLVNRTIIEVWNTWPSADLRANTHDGIVYEVDEGEVDQFCQAVKGLMERPLESLGGLVIPVDVKVGTHWGSGLQSWKPRG